MATLARHGSRYEHALGGLAQGRKLGIVPGYVSLSKEARGALKFLWRKAHVNDDWTKGGKVSEAFDRSTWWPYVAKPTYDLCYGTRVLAKIAYQVPAWREVISGAIEKFANRFPQYVAWWDWVDQKGLNPNCGKYPYFFYKHLIPPGYAGVYNSPGYAGNGLKTAADEILPSLFVAARRKPRETYPYYPQHSPAVGREYNPDPVYANGSSNMMFRGYFSEVLMHARIVSGDERYEQPYELVYDEKIRYTYDVKQIVEGLHDQHLGGVDENGSPLFYGIACEVGKMFPVCVSVGGLGTHLYDKVHGTNYRAGYDFWLEWARKNVTGPNPEGDYEYCIPYYDRDLRYAMTRPEQQMGGFWIFTALQLSPIDYKWARKIYGSFLKRFGVWEQDGSFHVNYPYEVTEPMTCDDRISSAGALAFAQEFNDTEHLEGLKRWFETQYAPMYKDGEFYYTFGIEESWPRGIPNEWALLSHIGGPGSWRRMYQDINLKKFEQPAVVGVDYPTVTVSQAYYDEELGALIFSMAPGTDERIGSETTFKVTNLDGGEREILADGEPYNDWKMVGDGEIEVQTTVAPHAFVIS